MSKTAFYNIGCHIGYEYFGSFGYVDDFNLLTHSIKALQKMIKTCEEFGIEFSVKYNPTKTVCIAFSKKGLNPYQQYKYNSMADILSM